MADQELTAREEVERVIADALILDDDLAKAARTAIAVITHRIRAKAARRIESGDPGARALEQMAEELEK